MRRLWNLKFFLIGLFIAYAVLINILDTYKGDPFYPLSHWRLWSHIPNAFYFYDLEVQQSDGRFISWTEDSRFVSVTRDQQTAAILDAWATSMRFGDAHELRAKRAFREGRLLKNIPVKYKIIEYKMDPFAYWKSRKLDGRRELGEFSVDAKQ